MHELIKWLIDFCIAGWLHPLSPVGETFKYFIWVFLAAAWLKGFHKNSNFHSFGSHRTVKMRWGEACDIIKDWDPWWSEECHHQHNEGVPQLQCVYKHHKLSSTFFQLIEVYVGDFHIFIGGHFKDYQIFEDWHFVKLIVKAFVISMIWQVCACRFLKGMGPMGGDRGSIGGGRICT